MLWLFLHCKANYAVSVYLIPTRVVVPFMDCWSLWFLCVLCNLIINTFNDPIFKFWTLCLESLSIILMTNYVSMIVTVDHCWSMIITVDHCWPLLINEHHTWPLLINDHHCWPLSKHGWDLWLCLWNQQPAIFLRPPETYFLIFFLLLNLKHQ